MLAFHADYPGTEIENTDENTNESKHYVCFNGVRDSQTVTLLKRYKGQFYPQTVQV